MAKWKDIVVTVVIGVGLTVCNVASAADMPMTEDDAPIRPYADGAGPTAIFRLGRLDSRHEDVFGVVDPLRWRIQYYTLADWALEPASAPFRDRWKPVGSCKLNPTFRLWRVHTFPQEIILQSQPIVPPGAFLVDKGAKPAPLSFRKIVLAGDITSLEAIADETETPSDTIPTKPCAAAISSGDGSTTFGDGDAAADISGGQANPFVVKRRATAIVTAFDHAKMSLAFKGRFLSSAQELEEGATVRSNQPIRHFLVTTRTNFPGFVSTETILLRRGESGQSAGTMLINLGLNRVKLGQHPVAVSSKGEVLVLGAPDHGGFRVHRCTYLPQPGSTSQCKIEEAAGGGTADTGAVSPASPGPTTPRDAPMWRTAFDYSERKFAIDTSTLPASCSPLVKTCEVDGITWTPLPELRGGQTGIIIRKGFPYGQMSGAGRPPTLKAGASDPTLGEPGRIYGKDGSKLVVFGDIYNDGAIRNPARARVFGIDCSSFLALLWGLPGDWETAKFISVANDGKKDIRRVEGLGQAHIGDAFVINITEDSEHKYINHIVLYREARDAGPSDTSRSILVVESNGSCAGVCWSFYDESFLNGWGILRHAQPRPDSRMRRIPTEGVEWRSYFVR